MSSTAFLRQTSIVAHAATKATSVRSFSVAARRLMPEGDAFNKREKANEDMYVRKQEQEKLEAMKKKIAEKEADLAKDRKEYEDATKGSK